MQEIMQFVGRHPILSIAWIALLVAVLVTTFKSLTSKVKVITRPLIWKSLKPHLASKGHLPAPVTNRRH